MTEIKLNRKLTNQLLHAAQCSPEQEICGLIGALDGMAQSCYAINNIADTPASRYQMDEKQQIQAMSAMRENNESLFAIYHSHPSASAEPSKTDIELASYPEAVQLIISLNTKGVLEIRSYRIIDQSSKELPLCLTQ